MLIYFYFFHSYINSIKIITLRLFRWSIIKGIGQKQLYLDYTYAATYCHNHYIWAPDKDLWIIPLFIQPAAGSSRFFFLYKP